MRAHRAHENSTRLGRVALIGGRVRVVVYYCRTYVKAVRGRRVKRGDVYYGLWPLEGVQRGSKLLPEINASHVGLGGIGPELTYFSISQYKR